MAFAHEESCDHSHNYKIVSVLKNLCLTLLCCTTQRIHDLQCIINFKIPVYYLQ